MRYFGSSKFSVPILIIAFESMMFGTVVEYAFGAQSARDFVYNSWWFMALIVCIGLSLLASVCIRFPWKLHQAGFIAVHLSIVLIIVSGFVTSLMRVEKVISLKESAVTRTLFSEESSFAIELVDHRLEPYPGTVITLSEESDVILSFQNNPMPIQTITILEPLSFRGWRIFLLGLDESGSIRVRVSKDPGLLPMYIGCWMLLLGVVIIPFTSRNSGTRQKVHDESRSAPVTDGGRR